MTFNERQEKRHGSRSAQSKPSIPSFLSQNQNQSSNVHASGKIKMEKPKLNQEVSTTSNTIYTNVSPLKALNSNAKPF